ncbi:MAG: hypothetical protein JWO38_2177 [Gemmataceae bacterium]|nr:hypothetical protein [Gemmataceae bacterium]
MAQLTLRTLLAYIDDTLKPALARQLGAKVAESDLAKELIERIKKVTRRRGLQTPAAAGDHDGVSDPNTVAEYLSDTLESEQVTRLEETCLQSDAHLADVAACHQILTLILTEPVRVPPRARERMYQLVPPPASVRNRRRGKTLPVGGVVPEARERAEPDDADHALLLGLGRYSAGSVLKRLGLLGAVLGLSVLLGVAVLMALPHQPPEPPETDRKVTYVGAPAQAGGPTPATEPAPKPPEPDPGTIAPPPKPKEPDPGTIAPPPKPKEGGQDLVKRVAPPRPARAVLGKVEGVNVIALTRADDEPAWLRLDPAGEAGVTGNDQVLALPGYKADVQLDTGVKVHLWGNVPELLPVRLLEARVRFHAPERKVDGKGEDFDADITLLAGRIYVSTSRPAGGRVRVRFAGEVWDITLADAKSEAVVEVKTAFDPGTPFAREGGQKPRVDALFAVVRGTAGLAAPERFKTFDKITAPAAVAWDSKGGTISDPKPVEPGNQYYDRFQLVGSDQGKQVQKALTDMAGRLTDRAGVKVMLAEVLTEQPDPGRVVAVQVAVYAQAAIVFGAAGDELKPLIDLLGDELRGYARVAVVNALAAWIAQAPGNTALLGQQLDAKFRGDGEAEIILRLLRGSVSPAKPDPTDLDRLVGFLTHPSVAVRELALWNLINFVDQTAPRTPGMVADVAVATGPGYEKFVKAWRVRVEEIKNRPPPKK